MLLAGVGIVKVFFMVKVPVQGETVGIGVNSYNAVFPLAPPAYIYLVPFK